MHTPAASKRRYSPDLARKIAQDLGMGDAGSVVLKLCNRSRGAGVAGLSTATALCKIYR